MNASSPGSAPFSGAPVTDLALQVRRVFSLYRMYGVEHELSAQVERETHQRFAAYLKTEPQFSFRLEPNALKYGDLTVLQDERREDTIVRSLYADGVESITFHAELQPEELAAYLRAWFQATVGQLGPEHTFSTLVWEADYANISTGFRPGLAEHGVSDEQRRVSMSRVGALYEAVVAGTRAEVPAGALVDGHALAALAQVEAFAQLDPAELDRTAAAEPALATPLSKSERSALLAGLLASRRGAGQRLLFGLWAALPGASPAERASAVALVTQVVRVLVEDKRSLEVCRALARIAEGGQADPARAALLAEFLSCLSDPAVVAGVVRLLELSDSAADAQALLYYLPPALAEQLLTPIEQAPRDQARRLLSAFVQKAPASEALALWLMERGEPSAGALFSAAEQLGPEHLDLLIRAALVHDDPRVRARGLRAIRSDAVIAYRSLMLARLADQSPEVRELALQAFVRAKDPEALPFLLAQLEQAQVEPEVARLCVRALGSLGGPQAAERLMRIVRESKDRELRRAAVIALGQTGHPPAVALLRSEGQRLFADRAFKEACRDARRRLEEPRAEPALSPGSEDS